MQRTAFRRVALSSLVLAALAAAGSVGTVGCAVGNDAEMGVSELDSVPGEGATEENSAKLPPSTKPTEGTTQTPADGGAHKDGGADSGKADSGVDAGPGVPAACASPNACTGATDLGSISGDSNADVQTAQGSGSQWFQVRVTENDNTLGARALHMKAELTSPAGSNFDVFLYLPGSGTGLECSSVENSSTTSGVENASIEWGESFIPNGALDDRSVTVEVRWVSGTCAPSAKWTLKVFGNTP
jgi:hypothetical protein